MVAPAEVPVQVEAEWERLTLRGHRSHCGRLNGMTQYWRVSCKTLLQLHLLEAAFF